MPKPTELLFALLATLVLAMPALALQEQDAPQAQALEPHDTWYVLNFGGKKAGYMHASLKKEGETYISTSTMKISIKRGAAEMTIDQSTRFVESLDHTPIAAESITAIGAAATKQAVDFTGEKWALTTTTAGSTSTRQVDPPDQAWLTPLATSAAIEAAIKKGDKKITANTMDLSVGLRPITLSLERGKSADIEVFGKVVPATQWTMTMSAAPGVIIEQWSDETGQPVRQRIPLLPGMEMQMLLADKELALAEFDAPEMLASSLITPDKPIKNPRKLRRAVYELSSPGLKKSLGDNIINDGFQRAEWVDDNTLRIEVDLDKPVAIESKQMQGGFDERIKALGEEPSDYWKPSSTLNYKDPAIKKLLKEPQENWFGGDFVTPLNYYNSAKEARQIVRDHIDRKDLSVGFATASETARTGQGDCTEHACLLAAMLRGLDIPSRTVTGLVYADQFAGREGVFGFHMWTQGWLQSPFGKTPWGWVDLDAAAPGQIDGFDATHIALSTSAMKDGETFNDMVKLLPLLQGLKIKVIEMDQAE